MWLRRIACWPANRTALGQSATARDWRLADGGDDRWKARGERTGEQSYLLARGKCEELRGEIRHRVAGLGAGGGLQVTGSGGREQAAAIHQDEMKISRVASGEKSKSRDIYDAAISRGTSSVDGACLSLPANAASSRECTPQWSRSRLHWLGSIHLTLTPISPITTRLRFEAVRTPSFSYC